MTTLTPSNTLQKPTGSLRFVSSLFAFLLGINASSLQAELQALDEASLARVVGKAGLTIDIETKVTIGEIEYVDAGSLFWRDFSLTGIDGGLVDNIRAKIDSTNGNEVLDTGFSDIARLADMGFVDANDRDVAWAISEYSAGGNQYGKQYGDGDLVIHVTSQDFGLDFSQAANPADHVSNLSAIKNAVDIHMQQGEFGIRSSDKATETVLTRNFSAEAYLGYFDIILKNNGNGFHNTATSNEAGKPNNILLADSYIALDMKFRVEDLDIDSTNNVTNPALPQNVKNPYFTIRDMRIHNERGADTLGSFGFASVQSKIAAASGVLNQLDAFETATHVDGQAIYDINVQWDWDLPHISFGDTNTSIGKVYLTDFQIQDTSMVISAH